MRLKISLLIATLLLSLSAHTYAAEVKGIEFMHSPWNEVLQKAKKEGRLIFVDFYTQWCGPCLMMAEEVFTLPIVYTYYNKTFVNAKIDAEAGEGIDLAKKYGVHVYPTYLFIDPVSGEIVHRSTSRQSAEQFIYTGESALIPERRSLYLESEYAAKQNDPEFLANYIKYKACVYQRDAVKEAFDRLAKLTGSLKNPVNWNIFCDNISGSDNDYIREVSADYGRYVALYGKASVDAKLTKETQYITLEELNKMCDFDGKYTNCKIIGMNMAFREKNYPRTIEIIDSAIADPKVNRQLFMQSLRFVIRNPRNEPMPKEWTLKCAEYYQFIAYNFEDRSNPEIHQEYAAYLEQMIRNVPECEKYFPQSIAKKPRYGKEKYTLRSDKLKPKPVKEKSK